MIRNELERRNAEKQLSYLRSELDKRSGAEEEAETTRGVASALRMQISDIEKDLTEYDDLKEGHIPILGAQSFDDLGALLIKGRIARDWSQADLARALDMETQQVQRYERNDWQTASLWRLQEAAEALNLGIEVRARLSDVEEGREEDEWAQVVAEAVQPGNWTPNVFHQASYPLQSLTHISGPASGDLVMHPPFQPSIAAQSVHTGLMNVVKSGEPKAAKSASPLGVADITFRGMVPIHGKKDLQQGFSGGIPFRPAQGLVKIHG